MKDLSLFSPQSRRKALFVALLGVMVVIVAMYFFLQIANPRQPIP